jgi:predicted component of viral defense system (DUF524 family)
LSPDFHLLLEVIRLGIEIDVGDTEIRQFAYTFNAAVGGSYNAETVVHIPKLGERTQARYPREVELMAREYIAISTGTPIDQVAVNWRRRTL